MILRGRQKQAGLGYRYRYSHIPLKGWRKISNFWLVDWNACYKFIYNSLRILKIPLILIVKEVLPPQYINLFVHTEKLGNNYFFLHNYIANNVVKTSKKFFFITRLLYIHSD